MEPEIKKFIDNVDAWIKQIRPEMHEVMKNNSSFSQNINHNFKMISEIAKEIDEINNNIDKIAKAQIYTLQILDRLVDAEIIKKTKENEDDSEMSQM